MVITGHDKYAPVWRTAVRVTVLECVARAIDARTLAVPDAEDAVDGPVGIGFDLLGPEDGGRRKILVDGGQELDAVFVEPR